MKKLVFAFAAVAAAMSFTGCSRRSTLTDGQFIVGFDADFKPYGFKEGEEYKGFDLDLARAVCERKGWKFVARPINWDAKDMELSSGSIDCIWNGFTIQGREDKYAWTSPYIDNSQVVLVRADSPIQRLSDLAGRIVAAQTDTPVLKALSKGGEKYEELGKCFKKLVTEPEYNNAVMDLESGAVEAVALDIGVAKQKLVDRPGSFRMLPEIVMTEQYGIGFYKDNTKLRDLVEPELKALFSDGTAARFAEKYGIEPNALILK